MKVDPRGAVYHLRAAVKKGNRGMADLLTETIVEHLERLDWIEEHGCLVEPDAGTWRVLAPYCVGPDVEHNVFTGDSLTEAIDEARKEGDDGE